MSKQTYTFSGLVSGQHGKALQAMTLTAVNFELSRQVGNHPSLKMPTQRPDSPDDMRDLLVLPELEGRDDIGPKKLDALLDGLVATCALIKDVASAVDYDNAGRLIRPFAWIIDRCRTPASTIEQNFAWRADMAAKVAGEQARMLGMKDTSDIETRANERAKLENAERMKYALAEVNSNTNLAIMQEDEVNLIDYLLDLNQTTFNGLKLAHAAAQNEMTRARKRLESGLYATVDSEVVMFAKWAMPE